MVRILALVFCWLAIAPLNLLALKDDDSTTTTITTTTLSTTKHAAAQTPGVLFIAVFGLFVIAAVAAVAGWLYWRSRRARVEHVGPVPGFAAVEVKLDSASAIPDVEE